MEHFRVITGLPTLGFLVGTENIPTSSAFPLGIAFFWHLMRLFCRHFIAKFLVIVQELFGLLVGLLLRLSSGSEEGDSAEAQQVLGCLLLFLGLVLEE